MKKHIYTLLATGFLFTQLLFAQVQQGLKNPGFECYTSCPTTFSQFDKVEDWFNPLSVFTSTPDYFQEDCGFTEFSASGGLLVTGVGGTNTPNYYDYQGCGRAGLFLNFNAGSQNPKYREYIAQRVDLEAGKVYIIDFEIQISQDNSTDDFERELAFYGYNGSFPASQTDFCINGAVQLSTFDVAGSPFNLDRPRQESRSIIPMMDFDYLIIGAACDTNFDATSNGYIFLDRMELTSTSTEVLTPIIEHFGPEDNPLCCFKGHHEQILLVGNEFHSSITASWGQSGSNPQAFAFTSPNNDTTSVTGSGPIAVGNYEFYYSFTKGGVSMTDTVKIEVAAPVILPVDVNDTILCNGQLTSELQTIISNEPNIDSINKYELTAWWQFIDFNDPTDIHVNYNPCITGSSTDWIDPMGNYRGNVLTSLGNDGCGGTIDSFSRNGPTTRFRLLRSIDTIFMVYCVSEQNCHAPPSCDTSLVIHRHVKVRVDKQYLCAPDTGLIYFLPSFYPEIIKDDLSITLNIIQESGPLGATILNPTARDSFMVKLDSAGIYIFRIEANQNGCIWYGKALFDVIDLFTDVGASDLAHCNANNHDRIYTEMRATPSRLRLNDLDWASWWTLINKDGSNHVFPNGNWLADSSATVLDGLGNLFITSNAADTNDCPALDPNYNIDNYESNSHNARFYYYVPFDSSYYVWTVEDPVCYDTLNRDTVLVVHRHIFAQVDSSTACLDDTVMMHLGIPFGSWMLAKSYPFINVTWSQTLGPPATIINPLSEDSVFVKIDTAGLYRFRATADDGTCTWSANVEFSVNPATIDVNAGNDTSDCSSVIANYVFNMNAQPNRLTLNQNKWGGAWSVLLNDTTEIFFPNGKCDSIINFMGPNDFINDTAFLNNSLNRVVALDIPNDTTCILFDNGSTIMPNMSNSPDAEFALLDYGTYTFIYRIFDCAGNISQDTFKITWDFQEPLAIAGSDTTINCATFSLDGNLSAASAGNTGCAEWRQIAGPATVNMLGANFFQSFVVGFDTLPNGNYTFVYKLGCNDCFVEDTIVVTNNAVPQVSLITIDTTLTNDSICVGDTIFLNVGAPAAGYQFQYFVNGVIYEPFTTEDTLMFVLTDSITSFNVVADDGSGCFESATPTINVIADCRSMVTLPIDLVSFEIDRSDCPELDFYWTTSTEINSSHFEIYALDEIKKVWTLIDKIEASQNSITNINYSYNFKPNRTSYGYYKIRLVDLDGSFKEGPIKSAYCGNNWESVSIYPNPTNGNINIKANFKVAEVVLYNDAGKQIYNGSLQQFSASDFPSGIYFITVIGDQQIVNDKFVKLD